MFIFVVYTNALSAHQIPLAREIAKIVGADNFRYIYTSKDGQKLQESKATDRWIRYEPDGDPEGWLENADVMLVGGIRPIGLCERRAASGKTTFYMSERWFKPSIGMFRLLHPKYFSMARRWVRLIRTSQSFIYLPQGIHAASDMARLCGLFAGDWRCLFRAPELDFERKPGGRIWLKNNHVEHVVREDKKYCLDKMRMWGYFVAPSKYKDQNFKTANDDDNSKLTTPNSQLKTLRVLWVGRLLKLKRVDTIIRAVGELSRLNTSHPPTPTRPSNYSSPPTPTRNSNSNLQLSLDIFGTGPEEKRLKKLAAKYGNIINFYPPVTIDEVRNLMRSHDIYVFASNGYEGWGAVVSEALEESMKVIGTYEAGSSATILPKSNLFHSGDWEGLMVLFSGNLQNTSIGNWDVGQAAKWIIGGKF